MQADCSYEAVFFLLCVFVLMHKCRHILSWSGGKDSTASVILAHLHGEPLDTIIFSEVMYCKERGISGENPLHIQFIKEVAMPLFNEWGYEVLILHSDKDYLDCFNHVIERPTKHLDHKGKIYGFCLSKRCVVKRDCKEKPIRDYLRSLKQGYMQYVGICTDEPARLMSLERDNSRRSLLVKYKYTEQMAYDLCMEYGLLSPLYTLGDKQKRQGCWFCPNAKLGEHLSIKCTMPEIWDEYISLEEKDMAFSKWNPFAGETLKERDKRLDEILIEGV